MLTSAAVSLTSTCLAAAAERTTAMWTVSARLAAERRKRRDEFRLHARVAVEVRYGWLCVVGVSGANAPVNAQPHQKIAAMLGRPGHSTAWCVDSGQCPLMALSRHRCRR